MISSFSSSNQRTKKALLLAHLFKVYGLNVGRSPEYEGKHPDRVIPVL
jgi:hypothetical protein